MVDGNSISELNESKSINKDDFTFIVQDEKTKKVFMSAFIDFFYPVGSLYVSITNQNPSKFIGGTWLEVGKMWCKGQYKRTVYVDTGIVNDSHVDGFLKLYKRTK